MPLCIDAKQCCRNLADESPLLVRRTLYFIVWRRMARSLAIHDDRIAPLLRGTKDVIVHQSSAKDDQKLCMMVANKLAARGIRSPCQVSVSARNGDITLSGTVVQAHQKNAASHAASTIEGVRRVNDNLVVKVAAKRSDDGSGQWTMKALKVAPEVLDEVVVVLTPGIGDSFGLAPSI